MNVILCLIIHHVIRERTKRQQTNGHGFPQVLGTIFCVIKFLRAISFSPLTKYLPATNALDAVLTPAAAV